MELVDILSWVYLLEVNLILVQKEVEVVNMDDIRKYMEEDYEL